MPELPQSLSFPLVPIVPRLRPIYPFQGHEKLRDQVDMNQSAPHRASLPTITPSQKMCNGVEQECNGCQNGLMVDSYTLYIREILVGQIQNGEWHA